MPWEFQACKTQPKGLDLMKKKSETKKKKSRTQKLALMKQTTSTCLKAHASPAPRKKK